MTVLFAGSAPHELGGSAEVDTSLTHRDPDFVPVGSKFTGNFDNSGVGFTVVTPAPAGKYWYHARFRTHADISSAVTLDGHLIEFYTADDEFIGSLDVSDGSWRLLSETGSTAAISDITPDTEYVMDVSLDVSGGSYTMELYFGGTLQGTLTWTSALARPTTAVFDFYDTDAVDSVETWYCSEVIVTDGESTIGWRLATLTPNADGTHTDWQGDYTGIETLGDGLGISSGTVGAKQSWTFAAVPAGVTGSSTIRGVFQSTVASVGQAAPPTITPFTRVSGTDYDETAFTPSTVDIVEFAQNPATSAPWTAAELASLEVGVKATS